MGSAEDRFLHHLWSGPECAPYSFLKHAFVDGRPGEVEASSILLSVRDKGVDYTGDRVPRKPDRELMWKSLP